MQKLVFLLPLICFLSGHLFAQERKSKKQQFYDDYWAKQEMLEKYNIKMSNAFDAFKIKNYAKAIQLYTEAINLNKEDQQAKAKIRDIEIILAESRLAEAVIRESTTPLSDRDSIELASLKLLNEVPEFTPKKMRVDTLGKPTPNSSKATFKEDKEFESLQSKDSLETKKTEKPVVSHQKPEPTLKKDEKTKSDSFRQLLAEKYSENSERTYTKANRTITERIVLTENKKLADEYMRVKHSWGGVYYFKNGSPISYQTWIAETEHLFPKGEIKD